MPGILLVLFHIFNNQRSRYYRNVTLDMHMVGTLNRWDSEVITGKTTVFSPLSAQTFSAGIKPKISPYNLPGQFLAWLLFSYC